MSLLPRDVIKRAMRLNGALASGDDPTSDELTDALEAFNTMQRSWFGAIIGVRLSAQPASGSSQQAENGGEYSIPAAVFTLTAPLNPRAGARFGVIDANLTFAANNCTIARNGRLLQEAAANIVLATNGDNRRWWYRDDTGDWVLEQDYADVDDPIFFPDQLIAYMPYMLAMVIGAEFNTELRQDVIAGAAEGRQAFARAYARRGRNQVDPAINVQGVIARSQPQPQQG